MRGAKVQKPTGRLHGGLSSAGRSTIADVAEAAGVSPMTVSRVINGGPVSDATKAAVKAAIAALGYRPNEAARMLAARRRPAPSSGIYGLWSPYSDFLPDFLKPRR